MTDPSAQPGIRELTLRERMIDYVGFFGIGVAACVLLGAVAAWLGFGSFGGVAGYGMVVIGGVLFLSGGVSGGIDANIRIRGSSNVLGPAWSADEDVRDATEREQTGQAEAGGRGDHARRLGRLGWEPNHNAFWQVIGGFAFFALGMILVLALGT